MVAVFGGRLAPIQTPVELGGLVNFEDFEGYADGEILIADIAGINYHSFEGFDEGVSNLGYMQNGYQMWTFEDWADGTPVFAEPEEQDGPDATTPDNGLSIPWPMTENTFESYPDGSVAGLTYQP